MEFKNAVVVIVLIFLKDNGLCGKAISSSQLCSQSIPCTCNAVYVHVKCTIVTMHTICEGPALWEGLLVVLIVCMIFLPPKGRFRDEYQQFFPCTVKLCNSSLAECMI